MASLSSGKIHSDKCLTFIGHDSVCAEDVFATVAVMCSSLLSQWPVKNITLYHINFAHFLAIICDSYLNNDLTI